MNSNTFKPTSLFDLTNFTYEELFKEDKPVWNAIANLSSFLEDLFSSQKIKANYKNSTNIYIGKNVTFEEGSEVRGPAIIGDDVNIGHAALIRGGCIIGKGVHIGHAVEVKHSIFLNQAIAAHLNYIGDSIIGNNVNISGGTICANYRLDKKPVTIIYDKNHIETGLPKLGAIIGDNSNIGVNAVLNPGTILSKQTVVYPLTNVRGIRGGIVKSDI